MLWTDGPIHFIDFEGNLTSGILEYGIVTVQQGTIRSAVTRLCRATGRIHPEDTAIHGLAETTVAAASPFSDDWELFARLRAEGPFAAHYASAENTLLKSIWPYSRHAPDFGRPGATTREWGPWIDSARLCADVYTQLPSGKLSHGIEALGLQATLDAFATQHCPADRRGYHAALYDAIAGALLLLAAGSSPRLAAATVQALIDTSTLNPEKHASLLQQELF